jgi:hypothetical protein
MTTYVEASNGYTTKAYGRILKMFRHNMFPGDVAAPTLFVVKCAWYEVVSVDPVTGNTNIRYNPNFEASNLVNLHDCIPQNCVFWPCDPLGSDDADLYTVITHHD